MRGLSGNTVVAYLAFLLFCLLSAGRDVISEVFFKDQSYGNNPVFVLFVYSVVTQMTAGTIFVWNALRAATIRNPITRLKKELLYLNAFTMSAYLFYFLAINSPLGAALNTFVDYGFGPVLTALVGVHLVAERLDKRFAWAALASTVGILILVIPRSRIEQISAFWLAGAAFSFLSSLSSAYFRVYFKILLDKGLDKSAIIFLRLIGTTLGLGLFLAVKPEWIRFDLIIPTAIVGIFGFTLPLFLILSVIERVNIRRYSMLLFLFPALTLLFAGIAGYAHIFISDILAVAIMIVGVVMNETGQGTTAGVEKDLDQAGCS